MTAPTLQEVLAEVLEYLENEVETCPRWDSKGGPLYLRDALRAAKARQTNIEGTYVDVVLTELATVKAERDALAAKVQRYRDMLIKCVTTGYSRHEINCLLAEDDQPAAAREDKP